MAVVCIHERILRTAKAMGYFPTMRQTRRIRMLMAYRHYVREAMPAAHAIRHCVADLMAGKIVDPMERKLLGMN